MKIIQCIFKRCVFLNEMQDIVMKSHISSFGTWPVNWIALFCCNQHLYDTRYPVIYSKHIFQQLYFILPHIRLKVISRVSGYLEYKHKHNVFLFRFACQRSLGILLNIELFITYFIICVHVNAAVIQCARIRYGVSFDHLPNLMSKM